MESYPEGPIKGSEMERQMNLAWDSIDAKSAKHIDDLLKPKSQEEIGALFHSLYDIQGEMGPKHDRCFRDAIVYLIVGTAMHSLLLAFPCVHFPGSVHRVFDPKLSEAERKSVWETHEKAEERDAEAHARTRRNQAKRERREAARA